MTEHKKAVKNRKRDLEAHHDHVHSYSDQAIAEGVMIFNISETFRSPTRREGDITTHNDPAEKVEHCMSGDIHYQCGSCHRVLGITKQMPRWARHEGLRCHPGRSLRPGREPMREV
jgi:hypothetical protein